MEVIYKIRYFSIFLGRFSELELSCRWQAGCYGHKWLLGGRALLPDDCLFLDRDRV
jgi:hypothetical protein